MVLNRKGRVWVKRLKNEKYLPQFITPRLQGGGGSAGIWGCFSYAGTSVKRIYTGRICLGASIFMRQFNWLLIFLSSKNQIKLNKPFV